MKKTDLKRDNSLTLSWKCVKNPVLKIYNCRMLMVPDQVLGEDGVILDTMEDHCIGFFTCVLNFSSLT